MPKGLPDSYEDFLRAKQAITVSVDSAKVFTAIRDDPTVKAVLAELRHTCYHGIAEYEEGEPITFGHFEKFDEVKTDAGFIFDGMIKPRGPAKSVRILDALGALIWSKERDA